MIDLAAVQRSLNQMPSPTNAEAARLLDNALELILKAIDGADGTGAFWADLPGGEARDNLRAEIQNRQAEAIKGAPGDAYPDPVALKRVVAAAAVELNAVAEGNATMAAARDALFSDIVDNILAVLGKLSAAVKPVAFGFGAALVALVAVLAWKWVR